MFDRGFDVRRIDASEGASLLLERSASPGKPTRSTRSRYVAIALVMIMLVSAFAMIAPKVSKVVTGPADEHPAEVAAAGPAEHDYTISNIGESYMKSTNYADHGRHTGTMGLNLWFLDQFLPPNKLRNYRNFYYGDLPVRNAYPYIIAYGPYSDFLSALTPSLFSVHSFYRLTIDAKNITGLGTGPNMDPKVLPILGTGPAGLPADGGSLQMWLYLTYLTYQETADITAGTHYANTYYGVPAGAVQWQGANYYDGWWIEAQGRWQFSRLAAAKFLGISGADLRTSFNTSNVGNALGNAWDANWGVEGSDLGAYNIYAAYDYPLSDGAIDVYLRLDPDWSRSTADSISVLMWSRTWGAEVLFSRYLDVTGVSHNLVPYMEDWYLNGTLNSEYGDVHERMTTVYHMTTWKDSSWFGPSWMIEGQHIDYTADKGPPSPDWVSNFDPYFQYYYDAGYEPTRMCWIPGQTSYGVRVHYWQTPMVMSLADGESLTIQLPTVRPGWGITPYGDASDILDAAKVTQLNSNGKWGEWVLGKGWPAWYYSTSYYDKWNKTLMFNGPMSFDRNPNPIAGYNQINESGSPQILLDISPVSHYEMVLPAPPYQPGIPYQLTVKATNFTNQVFRTWNGTVLLTAAGSASFGATSHTFVPGDTGWWNTTVTFGDMNGVTIYATDQVFGLDVWDTKTIPSGDFIPEFPTLLIPVIGAAAIFVVLRRRKTAA